MRNTVKLLFPVFCIAIGSVMTLAIANAQTYSSDNFDGPDESE